MGIIEGPTDITYDVADEVINDLNALPLAKHWTKIQGEIETDPVYGGDVLCIFIDVPSSTSRDNGEKILHAVETVIMSKIPDKIPIRDDVFSWSVVLVCEGTTELFHNISSMGGYRTAGPS